MSIKASVVLRRTGEDIVNTLGLVAVGSRGL